MRTLLLDTEEWDLVLDVAGNVAVASDPYAKAQDAASEARLCEGDLWYDTSQGIPYFRMFLGRAPSLSMLKAAVEAAALKVPGVVSAKCYIRSVVDRVVTGQVQITDASGVTTGVDF